MTAACSSTELPSIGMKDASPEVQAVPNDLIEPTSDDATATAEAFTVLQVADAGGA